MAKMRGADIIAEYLVKEEVPYLFGLCGHGIIGFLDALYDRQDKIKAMTVRHEQDVFQHAIDSNRPFVIDVIVERDAMGPSVGTWVLPPFPHPEPTYGRRNLRT